MEFSAMENYDSRLCNTLQPILQLEIAMGNSIASIEAPAGSNCSFAIHLANKLHHQEIKKLNLPNSVESWENKDRHYPLQSGYACTKYRHSIAGPL
jgi:hypothetical protein